MRSFEYALDELPSNGDLLINARVQNFETISQPAHQLTSCYVL